MPRWLPPPAGVEHKHGNILTQMPGRILLLFVLVAIVILVIRRLKRSSSRAQTGKRTTTGRMVQCAACGIYLPEQEAIVHQGKYYCSPSHRDGHKP